MAPRSRITTAKLKTFTPDPHNANTGTQRGRALLEESVKRHRMGRSILADKHGTIIAGNKTHAAAGAAGIKDAIVVKTDGSQLVIVQRTDLDLETDVTAKELAVADNRVGEVGLDWNVPRLESLVADGADLGKFFQPPEWDKLVSAEQLLTQQKTLKVDRPTDVAWVLVAIPLADWPTHQAAVESLQTASVFSTMVLRPKAQ